MDKRQAEVIDAPYFHVIFPLPHKLPPLLYCNQKLLDDLFHRYCAQTLLKLSNDKKYLGATPGIIQVLHAWNQEMDYHVHMHCIVSSGALTPDRHIRLASRHFFIPVFVLRDKFTGKYLALLDRLYKKGSLYFFYSCTPLEDSSHWQAFKDSLYEKDWCPYIKETFNSFSNAIEYLGRYTHKITTSNSSILSATNSPGTFPACWKKTGAPRCEVPPFPIWNLSGTSSCMSFLMVFGRSDITASSTTVKSSKN